MRPRPLPDRGRSRRNPDRRMQLLDLHEKGHPASAGVARAPAYPERRRRSDHLSIQHRHREAHLLPALRHPRLLSAALRPGELQRQRPLFSTITIRRRCSRAACSTGATGRRPPPAIRPNGRRNRKAGPISPARARDRGHPSRNRGPAPAGGRNARSGRRAPRRGGRSRRRETGGCRRPYRPASR